MSRISSDIFFKRTLIFDNEDFEKIIKDNFLLQTPEELLDILITLNKESALDDIIDVAYDSIEYLLVQSAQTTDTKEKK